MFHFHHHIVFDLLASFCINGSLEIFYGDLTEAEMFVSSGASTFLINGLATSLSARSDKSLGDVNRLRESSCTIKACVQVSICLLLQEFKSPLVSEGTCSMPVIIIIMTSAVLKGEALNLPRRLVTEALINLR